jgi:hypothetical protein
LKIVEEHLSLNQGLRYPVLHAAGRVLPLELHEDVRTIGWNDLAKSNYRCVSNSMENIHGLSSPSAG